MELISCYSNANSQQVKSHKPELLLKLTDNSGLDLVEILKLAERNEDNDSLAATIKVELLSGRNEGAVKVSLQLGGRRLQTRETYR